MNRIIVKCAGAAFVMVMTSAPLQAQMTNDGEFLQCVMDCQDFMPDQATVRACENWCYAYYNPN